MNIIRVVYKYKYFLNLEKKCLELTRDINDLQKQISELKIENNKIEDLQRQILELTDKKSNNTDEEKTVIKKRKNIPKTLKKIVWNKWIGEEFGNAKCLCCKVTTINQLSFHCGHVISHYNGGLITVDNLRPICSSCNLSMGKENMDDFMKRLKF